MPKNKAVFPVVILLLTFTLEGFRLSSDVKELQYQVPGIQTHPCPNGHIAITYDDGPNQAWTPLILDAFKARSAQGVFLIVGSNGVVHPDLLERMVAEYHQIGSHMYNHERVTSLTDEEIVRSIIRTNEVIHSVGIEPRYFRFPFFDVNDHVIDVVERTGMLIIPREVSTQDWQTPSADTIVERTLSGIQQHNGATIIMHDGWAHNDRSQTVLATPRIIDGARSMGYCIGAYDEEANVIPATDRNIAFADQDSGVPNGVREGATFLDWVWSEVSFDSYDHFVGVVRDLAYIWEEEGLLTPDERQAVLIAAMHAGIGK